MKQPTPDLIVAGKYCLERQLAAGGMGSVWVARHLDLDRDIAIKFMDPECASEEGRIRFELEAKAAFHLQSPYVVNVLDYGVDDDLPYIVMELLNGEDLIERLEREGRISLESAQRILAQAGRALRRAQELGIIHRDIKPHNLYLSKDDDGEESEETLKILDFGIAKETGPALVGEGTNTGHIVGSPNYMSPEHVRGAKDIDSRSDLWSLGVVMFQAITGRLPFPGDVVGDVIGMILADPIPRATDIAPDLPPEVDDFFFKALQRDRSLRFQTAKEMADAFNNLVRNSLPPGLRSPPSSASPPALSQQVGGLLSAPPSTSQEAAKGITAHIPNDDTLAKNAVIDAKRPSRTGGSRWGRTLAVSALILFGGIGLVISQFGGPKEVDPNATQASAPSAAQSAGTQPEAPQAGTAAAAQVGQGAPATTGGSPIVGQQPLGGRFPASPNQSASAPQAGQSATHATDTPQPETTASASTATHATDTPLFDVDPGGQKNPTGPQTGKGTTKPPTTKTGTKPAGSPSTNPSWGF